MPLMLEHIYKALQGVVHASILLHRPTWVSIRDGESWKLIPKMLWINWLSWAP